MQNPLRTRALFFMCGSPNIAGSLMALVGLGLFFSGVIQDWWLPIIGGLYAAGYLVMPVAKGLEDQTEEQAESTQESLGAAVPRMIDQARARLPAEAVVLLVRIQGSVESIAPKLFDGSMSMEHRIVTINAITRDLPSTVGNYLKLPAAFATLHRVEGDKTCKALLVEQLGLLEGQLDKMAQSAYANDAEAMKINGLVLREKFKPVSFLE